MDPSHLFRSHGEEKESLELEAMCAQYLAACGKQDKVTADQMLKSIAKMIQSADGTKGIEALLRIQSQKLSIQRNDILDRDTPSTLGLLHSRALPTWGGPSSPTGPATVISLAPTTARTGSVSPTWERRPRFRRQFPRGGESYLYPGRSSSDDVEESASQRPSSRNSHHTNMSSRGALASQSWKSKCAEFARSSGVPDQYSYWDESVAEEWIQDGSGSGRWETHVGAEETQTSSPIPRFRSHARMNNVEATAILDSLTTPGITTSPQVTIIEIANALLSKYQFIRWNFTVSPGLSGLVSSSYARFTSVEFEAGLRDLSNVLASSLPSSSYKDYIQVMLGLMVVAVRTGGENEAKDFVLEFAETVESLEEGEEENPALSRYFFLVESVMEWWKEHQFIILPSSPSIWNSLMAYWYQSAISRRVETFHQRYQAAQMSFLSHSIKSLNMTRHRRCRHRRHHSPIAKMCHLPSPKDCSYSSSDSDRLSELDDEFDHVPALETSSQHESLSQSEPSPSYQIAAPKANVLLSSPGGIHLPSPSVSD